MLKTSIKTDDALTPLREAVSAAQRKKEEAASKVELSREKVARLEAEKETLPFDEAAHRKHRDYYEVATGMKQTAERMLAAAEEECRSTAAALAASEADIARARDIAIRDESVTFVEREYPKVLDLLAKVQTAIRDGNDAARRANAAAREDDPRIVDVESALKRVPHWPHEVIEETTRQLWGYEDEREPLPEEFQRQVIPAGDGRTGVLNRGRVSDSSGFSVSNVTRGLVKRPFLVTRFKPMNIGYHLDLIADAKLPPLRLILEDRRTIQTTYQLVKQT